MRKLFDRYTILGATLAFIAWVAITPRATIAGIIQAIIPAAVPTANKQGNSSKFQLGTGTPGSGDCAAFDASGNIQSAGVGNCTGSAGGSVAFSGITGATNSSATMVVGTGASLNYTGSGSINASGLQGVTGLEGNGSKVQLFTGSDPATNDCAKFDANHNLVTAGSSCGGSLTFVPPLLTSGGNTYGPLYLLSVPTVAGLTWVNQTSGTVTAAATDTAAGLLLTSAPVSGDNARLLVKTLAAPPYTITAGIFVGAWSENFVAVGIALYETGSTKIRFFGCNSGQWRLMHQASPTGSGTFDLSSDKAPTSGLIWLRIVDDGSGTSTARKFYILPDGTNPVQFGNFSEASSANFTTAPNRWGLYLNNNSSAYQGQLTAIYMNP